MSNIYFIHGLLSTPETATGKALDNVTGVASIKLDYSPEYTWSQNWSWLRSQTSGASSSDIFVGESMGGFFAAQLASRYDAKFYGWNPVIVPGEQLLQFVGEQYIEDGRKVVITEEAILSYWNAPDQRGLMGSGCVGLMQSPQDDLLPYKLALSYYESKLNFVDLVTDGHSIQQPTSFKIAGSRVLAWAPDLAYPIIRAAKD